MSWRHGRGERAALEIKLRRLSSMRSNDNISHLPTPDSSQEGTKLSHMLQLLLPSQNVVQARRLIAPRYHDLYTMELPAAPLGHGTVDEPLQTALHTWMERHAPVNAAGFGGVAPAKS